MKVKDLIAELQKLDPEDEIYYHDYENGPDQNIAIGVAMTGEKIITYF